MTGFGLWCILKVEILNHHTSMIRTIRKRALFLWGAVLTGLVGIVGASLRTSNERDEMAASKGESLFSDLIDTAYADVSSGGSGSCFPAGTMVSTPAGNREIQTLQVGEKVYGFDTATGKVGEYPITQVTKHGRHDEEIAYAPLIRIAYADGVLTATENHWIYKEGSRKDEMVDFERAGQFQVGDVLTLLDGSTVAVTSVVPGPEYDFVYNLEVEGVHTYFADGVRVHNGDSGGDGGGSDGGCSGVDCGSCCSGGAPCK